jgi:hypothetical protein
MSADRQKFLQYETVLGPEDGDVVPPPGATASHGDEEKNIGGNVKDNTVPISGPGLGDLHTVGDASDVRLHSPKHKNVSVTDEIAIRIGPSTQIDGSTTRQNRSYVVPIGGIPISTPTFRLDLCRIWK